MKNAINPEILLTLQYFLDSEYALKTEVASKLFGDRIGSLLERIPQFIELLDEDNLLDMHQFFVEFGRYVKYFKYRRGDIIQHACDDDKFFYMVATGKIIKLNIRFKNIYISLKDYILHLTKLILLKQKCLYIDCIHKNNKVFPLNENIDLIKAIEKINFLDLQNEFQDLEKRKENIFANFHSKGNKENINDLLALYNPDIKILEKNNFLNKEMKFSVGIPFFYFDSIIEPISFIGHLNKNKGIKNFSTYICLNNCDIFLFNKDKLRGGEKLFSFTNIKKGELIVSELIKKHHLFKNIEFDFLEKNFSKYFEAINVKKGDYIIRQGNEYEGVYFLNYGIMQLKTYCNYNELNNLNYCILTNLMNNINDKESLNIKTRPKNDILNKLIDYPLLVKKLKQKKELIFGTYTNNEIIGLNDLYDKKTYIFNFSVVCTSKEAELFFLPRILFANLSQVQEIKEKINILSYEKNKLLQLKIQKNKKLFELELEKYISNENYKNNNNISLNDKNISIYLKKMSLNSLEFKNEKNIFEKSNKMVLSKSTTDIKKKILKIKYFNLGRINNKNTHNKSNNFFSKSLALNDKLENNDNVIYRNKDINQEEEKNNNKSQNNGTIIFKMKNLNNKNNDNFFQTKSLFQSFNKNKKQNIFNLKKIIRTSSMDYYGKSFTERKEKSNEKIKIRHVHFNQNLISNRPSKKILIPIKKNINKTKIEFSQNKQ